MWVGTLHEDGGWGVTNDTLMGGLETLPATDFPLTKRYAAELAAGQGHERFDFALATMLDSLSGRRGRPVRRG